MILRWKREKLLGEMLCFFIAACFFSNSLVWAQRKEYPNDTIEVILPVGPGGSSDIATRVLTDELSRELKVPFVVTNLEGASGLIGASRVLKAKPDGYTWLSCDTTTFTSSILTSPNPPFDPFKDFIPICSYGFTPLIYGVRSSSPFRTLDDFISYARKNPGTLNVGISNVGKQTHLSIESFRRAAALNVKIVPFKATGELVAALLGGHIDMLCLSYTGFLSYSKSGEGRILVITQKIPNSGIPTLAEAGYPQVKVKLSLGCYLSAKTPKGIFEKLIPVFEGLLKKPDVVKKLENCGVYVQYISSSQFISQIKEEYDTYYKLLGELGLLKK